MWQVKQKALNDQIIIDVGLLPFLPESQPVQSTSEPISLNVEASRALIDTGAQLTCITKTAILKHGLNQIGVKEIAGVGGQNLHRVVLFHLGVNCESANQFDEQGQKNLFIFPEPQLAVEIPDNSEFDVIIGMNILGRCQWSYEKSSGFILNLPF